MSIRPRSPPPIKWSKMHEVINYRFEDLIDYNSKELTLYYIDIICRHKGTCTHYKNDNESTRLCYKIYKLVSIAEQFNINFDDNTVNLLYKFCDSNISCFFDNFYTITKCNYEFWTLIDLLFKKYYIYPILINKALRSLFTTQNETLVNHIITLIDNPKFDINLDLEQKYEYYSPSCGELKHIPILADYVRVLTSLSTRVNNTENQVEALTNILLKKIKLNEMSLTLLFNNGCKYLSDKLAQMVDKYGGTIQTNIFDILFRHLLTSQPIIKILLDRGHIITSKHLLDVCLNGEIESLKFILENMKDIIIDKTHLNAIVVREDKYKYFKYKCDSSEYKQHTQEKVQALLDYGYKLTYDDVKFGIQNKFEFQSIEKYNIVADDNLLNICHSNKFYPKYNFAGNDKLMIELQGLCTVRNIGAIRKFITLHKLIPDSKCMENASEIHGNYQIYQYLIESGGILTNKCLKKILKKHSPKWEFLVDFIKPDTFNPVKPPYRTSKIDKSNESNKTDLEAELEIELDEELNKNKNKNIDIDINRINKENQLEILDIDIFIDDDELNEIRTKYSALSPPPRRYLKAFKIKSKRRISFDQLRNFILEQINQNNWFKVDDQSLIVFPHDILDILRIDKVIIRLDDLDKFVCLFYS